MWNRTSATVLMGRSRDIAPGPERKWASIHDRRPAKRSFVTIFMALNIGAALAVGCKDACESCASQGKFGYDCSWSFITQTGEFVEHGANICAISQVQAGVDRDLSFG